MSKERIFEVLKELRQLGGRYVSFSGGEMFLLRESYDILSFAKSLGFKVAANSNGWLINQKNAEKLSSTGIDIIFFSLDGPSPQIHDWIRGVDGAWKKVLEAIQNVKKTGERPKVFVNITVNRKNLPVLYETVKLAIETGADGVTIEPMHEVDKYSPMAELVLREEDIPEMEKQTEKILKDFSSYLPHFHDYIKKFSDFIRDLEGLKRSFRCIAAYFSVQIHPNGDVHPCPVAFYKMGNLRKSSFRQIWFSSQAMHLRERIKKGDHPPCWFTCVSPANLYLSYIRKLKLLKIFSPSFISYVLKEKI